ncbi:VanZ family protein [Chryseobacterium chendengshani]|uniref:VanZ family protein n=1 Tax=unclassified Chryseobacterium TaxID=2593645 RepID=UPI001C63D73D|nr:MULTISPECIES: VanZ family protein [unclassified Chryseobacterium]MBW7676058.1 VanZ family protein [Chryseobacterium sp. LJ756]MBW8524337.1 VanZ family protein [Chryseobacterium sp. LJ668]QYK17262.1 VanZ family protein [Chryseobacterium sp. LJ668]
MKRYFAVFIALYTTVLLYMMFYASGREPSGISYLQLKPFITIQHFFTGNDVDKEAFLVNIIGNVFLFCPFGWLGLCINKFDKLVPITLLFLIGISIIESVQYITGRGVADIDDIFLNTLGMLLGYFLFKYATWKNIANIRFHFNLLEDKKHVLTVS